MDIEFNLLSKNAKYLYLAVFEGLAFHSEALSEGSSRNSLDERSCSKELTSLSCSTTIDLSRRIVGGDPTVSLILYYGRMVFGPIVSIMEKTWYAFYRFDDMYLVVHGTVEDDDLLIGHSAYSVTSN